VDRHARDGRSAENEPAHKLLTAAARGVASDQAEKAPWPVLAGSGGEVTERYFRFDGQKKMADVTSA
jgi:hypothetical protein